MNNRVYGRHSKLDSFRAVLLYFLLVRFIIDYILHNELVLLFFTAVILSTIFYYNPSDDDGSLDRAQTLKLAFRLYRAPFLIVLFIFLIGVNIYGWRSAGCNHVLIFELDPRNHLSEQHLMEMAGIFGVVWSISVLTFLYSQSLSIPPFVNPLALIFVMICFICNPFKVFRWEARFWLLRTVVSTI